jgi:hypothetical protein
MARNRWRTRERAQLCSGARTRRVRTPSEAVAHQAPTGRTSADSHDRASIGTDTLQAQSNELRLRMTRSAGPGWRPPISQQPRRSADLCAGRTRTWLLSVTGFPSAGVTVGRARCSRLVTWAWMRVGACARSARLCRRHERQLAGAHVDGPHDFSGAIAWVDQNCCFVGESLSRLSPAADEVTADGVGWVCAGCGRQRTPEKIDTPTGVASRVSGVSTELRRAKVARAAPSRREWPVI